MKHIYDLAIIGGGPAGYTTAEKASENGLKTILFEKNELGGVCLNEGCIPTKTLLYSAKIFDLMKHSSKYGIDTNGTPSFNYDKIVARKKKVVKKLVGGIKMKLKTAGVDLVQGHASFQGEKDDLIQISCNEQLYGAKHVLLCTGSETVIPPIKGLAAVNYWTSKEALMGERLPDSLVIIGGGVIGIEFASFFHSMGVKVSVVEMASEILGVMDKETSGMLRAEYAKKGVDFYLDAKVIEVTETQVHIEKGGEPLSIPCHQVLVSTGRRSVTQNMGLETLTLKIEKQGVAVNEYMLTNQPHLYACGDVTGHSMLAHTAIREGEVALNHILGLEDKMNYHAIPGVVYTNPEIAGVGKTEEELRASGEAFEVLKLPLAYSGRFVAENELGSGICKLILNAKEQVIGCHILGNPASELIVIGGIAIEHQLTVDAFKKIVFPHPTVGEIFHESLFA